MKPRFMPCADCNMKPQWFDPIAPGDYSCTHCGWMQYSSPAGAAELCREATWHSKEAYDNYARIARSAGYGVPAEPPKFVT